MGGGGRGYSKEWQERFQGCDLCRKEGNTKKQTNREAKGRGNVISMRGFAELTCVFFSLSCFPQLARVHHFVWRGRFPEMFHDRLPTIYGRRKGDTEHNSSVADSGKFFGNDKSWASGSVAE